MPLRSVPLGTRSNPERTNDDGASVLINCYAEDAGGEGEVQYPLYACDGFDAFSTLTGSGAGVVRGFLNLDDTTLYVGTGTRLNRVTTGGTATDMGALSGTGPVYMARNRATTPHVFIVPSSGGAYYTIQGNVLSEPSLDVDIPKSLFNSVCSIDGYGVITASNGEWYITGIDAATIDELDFSTAASNPDGLTRGIVRGREVCLFGPRSLEFYTNTGAADFPFEKIHASSVGIYAGPTAVALTATLDGSVVDTVIWCATNADGAYIGVCMLGGYDARPIGAPWVNRAVRDATKSTLRASAYTREGITFYTLTSSTFSAEYNTRTGLWHKRTSSGLDFWRVADAVTFNGQTIYGDYSTAAIYQANHAITRGTASTSTFKQSFDGGTTWNTERTGVVGAAGSSARIKHLRLGQAKEDGRVFEIAISNAVMEAGTGNTMTVRPPLLHAWPARTVAHGIHIDVTKGSSLTNKPMGIKQIAVDVDGDAA